MSVGGEARNKFNGMPSSPRVLSYRGQFAVPFCGAAVCAKVGSTDSADVVAANFAEARLQERYTPVVTGRSSPSGAASALPAELGPFLLGLRFVVEYT